MYTVMSACAKALALIKQSLMIDDYTISINVLTMFQNYKVH